MAGEDREAGLAGGSEQREEGRWELGGPGQRWKVWFKHWGQGLETLHEELACSCSSLEDRQDRGFLLSPPH